jgi:hypothetical protein
MKLELPPYNTRNLLIEKIKEKEIFYQAKNEIEVKLMTER